MGVTVIALMVAAHGGYSAAVTTEKAAAETPQRALKRLRREQGLVQAPRLRLEADDALP